MLLRSLILVSVLDQYVYTLEYILVWPVYL